MRGLICKVPKRSCLDRLSVCCARKQFPKLKQRCTGFNPLQLEVLELGWIPHFSDPVKHLQHSHACQTTMMQIRSRLECFRDPALMGDYPCPTLRASRLAEEGARFSDNNLSLWFQKRVQRRQSTRSRLLTTTVRSLCCLCARRLYMPSYKHRLFGLCIDDWSSLQKKLSVNPHPCPWLKCPLKQRPEAVRGSYLYFSMRGLLVCKIVGLSLPPCLPACLRS